MSSKLALVTIIETESYRFQGRLYAKLYDVRAACMEVAGYPETDWIYIKNSFPGQPSKITKAFHDYHRCVSGMPSSNTCEAGTVSEKRYRWDGREFDNLKELRKAIQGRIADGVQDGTPHGVFEKVIAQPEVLAALLNALATTESEMRLELEKERAQ